MLSKINRRSISILLNGSSLFFNFLCFVIVPNWTTSFIHLLFCVINTSFIYAEKNNMFDKVFKK